MKLTGENLSTWGGETCPCATLSTTNPTWTDPGSNPDFRGERPATNRLSHGTANTDSLVYHNNLTLQNFNVILLFIQRG
jgi:hypothetical protein